MTNTDETTERLEARMAYLGIRDKSPTADLLPKKSLPPGLLDPDCRHVAAHLVSLVREVYSRCRRRGRELATRRPDRYGDRQLMQWDGGYDWRGRYHAPVWAKIAGAARGRGFDVADFVETQFALAAGSGSPYPNKLLTPAALDRYDRDRMGEIVEALHISRRAVENHFAVQVAEMMGIFGQPSRETAALSALRNPMNSLKAFFRYWVVARFDRGTPEYRRILATYRRPALREYAASVRAHDAAYDNALLWDFRLIIEQTRLAFVDLIAGDQGRWLLPPAEPPADARRQDKAGPAA
jgi:hypothetical protein